MILMLAIAAWIAKQNVLGFQIAQRQGWHVPDGRGKFPADPSVYFRRDEVVRLRDMQRMSWRAITAALNIPVTTAVDAYQCSENVSPKTSTGDGNDSTSPDPIAVFR